MMTALPSSAVLLLLCLSLSSFLFAASTDDVASIRISAEQYQTVNVPLPEEAGKTINMDSTSETGTLDLNVPLSSPSSSAPSLMSLGVCYYPEQWAQRYWEEDIRQMKQVGIKYVRLGEFFWIMDREHVLDFSLFDHVLNLLDKHGIQAILSTPTATPPRWLIKEHPEVLPTDINNLTRKFGSRRHYSFSSDYRSIDEVNTVISALASRYAQDTRVAGWQLDNEYGCHDTVRSYGPAAKRAFQKWLAEYYHHNITALNTRWGNSFWSMDYDDWSEIELPNNAVTVSNPSHWLSFYRFSSDQLISFNKWQVEIFREHMNSTVAPQFLTTNLMGFFFNFDAYALSADLDMIVWDSYPLGFTDSTLGIGEMFTPGEKVRYARTGHVDLASFHHSLYRNMHQRMPKAWGIMEQQPGPVNWGQYNPSPAPGMVRVWTWEALAHGASFVSYFRWRQADKAQEQMHTGLKRVDNSADAAFFEASQTHDELQACQASFSPSAASSSSPFSFSSSAPRQSLSSSSSLLHLPMAALVFSYEAQWMFDIDSKATGNRDVNYIKQCYDLYSALRANSFIVDVVPPRASKITSQHYDVIVVPSLLNVDDEDSRLFLAALASADVEHTPIVLGPRFASKTTDFGVKAAEDSALWSLMHIKVDRVETLRPGLYERVSLVSSSSSLSSSFSTYSSSSSASTGASKSNPKVFEVGVWKEYISVDPAYSHTGSPQVTIEARFGVNSGNVAYTDGDKHSVGVSDAAKTNGAVFKYKNRVYWSFWPTKSFMDAYIQRMCNEYSIKNCAPLTSRTQSEASDDVMDGADAEHIDTDIRLNSILVSETEVAAMMKARSRNARANSSTVKSTPVWSSDASEYQHNTKTTHMNNSQASLRLYIATNYGPEEQPYPFPLSSLPHSGENEDNKGERDDESSTGREKMVFLIGSSDSIAGYGVAVWYYV